MYKITTRFKVENIVFLKCVLSPRYRPERGSYMISAHKFKT